MIQDAQSTYEATVREHLQALQKDGEGSDKRFPQLYANVKRWQDQLEPVLKEFESRPEFNIHEYSTKFLSKMTNIQKGAADEAMPIPFSRLVYGQPRWEVCRRFLTCLILTNHGNTDILYDGEEERLNGFRVKLLKAEKKMISLEGEDAGAAQETTTTTTASVPRGAKKALSSAAPEQAGRKRHKSTKA